MTKDKRLEGLARTVATTGEKPLSRQLPTRALSDLQRAAQRTTVSADKESLRKARKGKP